MIVSSQTIQSVKDVPLMDVITHYVKLRKRGANYIGLCPFHDERTPSFYIHHAKNIYKCFGCGAGGNALKFVMDIEKKTFIEAVELIAGIAGIAIEAEQRTARTKRTPDRPKKKIFRPTPFDTIPLTFFESGTTDIAVNPLATHISDIVSEDVVKAVLNEYKIILNGCWITYPQIDNAGRYRTGKSICYDKDGHRAKIKPKWVHHELKQTGQLSENFHLKQCFTGEHLINNKPVAIVEGQSTMLFMATLGKAALKYHISQLKYFAGFTWIATGGSDGIGWKDEQVMQALKGKDVVLFPDAGFYNQWLDDAELMQEHGIRVQVSQLIESKYSAGQLKYNQDLRDYFNIYSEDIKHLCNPNQVHVYSNEIISSLGELHTGRDFNRLIIAGIKTNSGMYDLLFNLSGELIKPGDQAEYVKKVAAFFEKNFQPIYFDNCTGLAHCYN